MDCKSLCKNNGDMDDEFPMKVAAILSMITSELSASLDKQIQKSITKKEEEGMIFK